MADPCRHIETDWFCPVNIISRDLSLIHKTHFPLKVYGMFAGFHSPRAAAAMFRRIRSPPYGPILQGMLRPGAAVLPGGRKVGGHTGCDYRPEAGNVLAEPLLPPGAPGKEITHYGQDTTVLHITQVVLHLFSSSIKCRASGPRASRKNSRV